MQLEHNQANSVAPQDQILMFWEVGAASQCTLQLSKCPLQGGEAEGAVQEAGNLAEHSGKMMAAIMDSLAAL